MLAAMIPGHVPSADEPRAGDQLGRYLLHDALGEGGMGVVFRATDTSDGSVVALKLLRTSLSTDPTFRRRFDHEARIARSVEQRHLVPMVDAGEVEGRHYIAYRYVEGGTLADRLRQGVLPAAQFVSVIAHVASGLDALHRAGLIHRDVKPSNVLLDSGGAAMLTDFGLAKGPDYTVLTMPHQIMGTADYMAPELIRGAAADQASDIYALGCMAYECLVGTPPFAGSNMLAVATAQLGQPPPDPCTSRPELPAGFGLATQRAMAKDARERPTTAVAYSRMLTMSLVSG